MPEILDEQTSLESTTIGVFRTAATIKGGRRFSFSSLVVVGDRRGQVSYGYGKANEVPSAIEKAQKEAKKTLKRIPLHAGTLPHEVTGRYGASKVRLIPASPGTGVVAGAPVRAVLEMLGVTDCLTKCYGSTNKQNVVKAAFDGLSRLQPRETIEQLRGVEIGATEVDVMIERGQAFLPSGTAPEKSAKERAEEAAERSVAQTDEVKQQEEAAPAAKPQPEGGGDQEQKSDQAQKKDEPNG